MVRNAQNMSLGSNRVDRVRSLRKIQRDFVAQACASISLVQPILYPSSCSHKMVQNAQKHEFGVQWGGSGVFVAKNSDATSVHELMH
jgi:hypothetical protein